MINILEKISLALKFNVYTRSHLGARRRRSIEEAPGRRMSDAFKRLEVTYRSLYRIDLKTLMFLRYLFAVPWCSVLQHTLPGDDAPVNLCAQRSCICTELDGTGELVCSDLLLRVQVDGDDEPVQTQYLGENEDQDHTDEQPGLLRRTADTGITDDAYGETSGKTRESYSETGTKVDESSEKGQHRSILCCKCCYVQVSGALSARFRFKIFDESFKGKTMQNLDSHCIIKGQMCCYLIPDMFI